MEPNPRARAGAPLSVGRRELQKREDHGQENQSLGASCSVPPAASRLPFKKKTATSQHRVLKAEPLVEKAEVTQRRSPRNHSVKPGGSQGSAKVDLREEAVEAEQAYAPSELAFLKQGPNTLGMPLEKSDSVGPLSVMPLDLEEATARVSPDDAESDAGLHVQVELSMAMLADRNLPEDFLEEATGAEIEEALKRLTSIRLDREGISTVGPATHAWLPHISSLYLHWNRLPTLQPWISLATSLRSLVLSHNHLSDLDGLRELTSLIFLDAAYNSIIRLGPEDLPSSIAFLDLRGNPLCAQSTGDDLRERFSVSLHRLCHFNGEELVQSEDLSDAEEVSTKVDASRRSATTAEPDLADAKAFGKGGAKEPSHEYEAQGRADAGEDETPDVVHSRLDSAFPLEEGQLRAALSLRLDWLANDDAAVAACSVVAEQQLQRNRDRIMLRSRKRIESERHLESATWQAIQGLRASSQDVLKKGMTLRQSLMKRAAAGDFRAPAVGSGQNVTNGVLSAPGIDDDLSSDND